ncbi:MAG: tRNA-intron lyase [Nanoarchaeota archaeon]|nr:tRNA-intron lyase [Nanoarchaeota archaeon]
MAKEPPAEAILTGDKVIILDKEASNRIFNKGWYGQIVRDKLELALVEALFLMQKGTIVIKSQKGRLMDLKRFIKEATKVDPRFYTRYTVYADIRKRGYITKTALKYGADFRVYERGTTPGQEHAKWVLFAVHETEIFDWRKFAAMMRVAHSVRKKLLIGIVDDEGDVTYYEVRWTRP